MILMLTQNTPNSLQLCSPIIQPMSSPGMGNKVIHRDVHSIPLNDVTQCLHDEFTVKSIWERYKH